MLMAAIENFILFSTLLALAGFALAWTVRGTAEQWRGQLSPHVLTRVYEAAVALPPVMAAWLVAAALLPKMLLGEAAFDAAHPAPHHQLHLLGDLTSKVEPALAYLVLSLAAGLGLCALWSSGRAYSRIGSLIERLEMSAAPPLPEQLALVRATAARHGLDVGLVMSNCPFSFVWGFRRSKLVLSSGLLQALTAQELIGVLEHEAAHHARRDNLIKLLLSIGSYASLAFPLSRLVLRWRTEQVEMICDEVAAARTSAPLEIAEALVKLRRQTLAPIGRAPAGIAASSFAPHNSSSIKQRVRRLITFADAPPAPSVAAALSRGRRAEAFVLLGIFTATLISIYALAPLAVHRATESLIQFLK